MSEMNDKEFDALFREFLSDQLDPHQGRSERHFRGYLDDVRRGSWKRRNWLIGTFISGVAASVAMLWAAPLFHVATPGNRPPLVDNTITPPTAGSDAPILPAMERVVQSQTADEGVVLLGDDAPFRVLRHQSLEQKKWFDERQKVRAEEVTPQEDLVFIRMPTY